MKKLIALFVFLSFPAFAQSWGSNVVPVANGGTGASTGGIIAFNNDATILTMGSATFSNSTPNGSGFYIERTNNSINDGHGLTIADNFISSETGGLSGYGGFNNYTNMAGTVQYNHHNGFQDVPTVSSTGGMITLSGFASGPNVSNGTVIQRNGLSISDVVIGTSGAVTTQAGVYIASLTNATNNWAIYSPGTLTPSYHMGNLIFGGKLYGNLGVVAGNANFYCPTGTSYCGVYGTVPLNWSSGGQTYGDFSVGDAGTGASFLVNTPSLNTAFGSGFAVNGSYSSSISTVNVGALGVYSAGGFGSNLNFYTTNGTAKNNFAIFVDQNGNVGLGTSVPLAVLDVHGPVKTAGYTVSGLPSGSIGMRAYVTDQLTSCVGAGVTLTGGGTAKCPVFYNGSAWVGD